MKARLSDSHHRSFWIGVRGHRSKSNPNGSQRPWTDGSSPRRISAHRTVGSNRNQLATALRIPSIKNTLGHFGQPFPKNEIQKNKTGDPKSKSAQSKITCAWDHTHAYLTSFMPKIASLQGVSLWLTSAWQTLHLLTFKRSGKCTLAFLRASETSHQYFKDFVHIQAYKTAAETSHQLTGNGSSDECFPCFFKHILTHVII